MSRPAAARARTPVLVLAGFLGSGKTTLLNHLLHNDLGVRIGVIVNDFGAVNVDAMLVAGQVDAAVGIGSGCVCCITDTSDLDRMLSTLSTSESVDAIVIEASGLAEPRALIRMVTSSAVPTVRYGGLIELVDAAAFDAHLAEHPEIGRQLALADLVVVNKIDLLGDDDAAGLRERVRALAGPVPLVETVRARLDPQLLFDPRESVTADGPRQMTIDEILRADADDHDEHLHARFDTVDLDAPGRAHPHRLAALLEQPPSGAYRVKGVVAVGGDRPSVWEVQTVGRHVHVAPAPAGSPTDRCALVIIGAGIDAGDARDRLTGALLTAGERVESTALAALTRYLDPESAPAAAPPPAGIDPTGAGAADGDEMADEELAEYFAHSPGEDGLTDPSADG